MSWVGGGLLTLAVQVIATWVIAKTWGEFLFIWGIIVGIQVVCAVLNWIFDRAQARQGGRP